MTNRIYRAITVDGQRVGHPPKIAVTIAAAFAILTFSRVQAAQQAPAITIEHAREMLETSSSGEILGNISLTAVNYFREVGLGHGIRTIVVSTNMGGGIAIFSSKGVMESSLATGEADSIRLFDLNGDGVSEILTDEITDRGTGIPVKNFNLYAVSGNGIRRVWKGLSYRRETPWQPGQATIKVHELQNFIRFDGAGAGYPSRMTYLVSTGEPNRFRKIEYVMTGSTVRALSEPAKK